MRDIGEINDDLERVLNKLSTGGPWIMSCDIMVKKKKKIFRQISSTKQVLVDMFMLCGITDILVKDCWYISMCLRNSETKGTISTALKLTIWYWNRTTTETVEQLPQLKVIRGAHRPGSQNSAILNVKRESNKILHWKLSTWTGQWSGEDMWLIPWMNYFPENTNPREGTWNGATNSYIPWALPTTNSYIPWALPTTNSYIPWALPTATSIHPRLRTTLQ
jgi:hypothetical protein